MRIVYLANNWVGWQVAKMLKESPTTEVVGLVVHHDASARYREEICETLGVESSCVFDGANLREEATLHRIASLKADAALSAMFGYIVKPSFIDLFPKGVINLHPSYLPYCRGKHPNIWSIVEGEPAGVTLHYIDPGIDTGDIIAQREVAISPTDTGESLYRRLEGEAVALLADTWPAICAGEITPLPQPDGGSMHYASDVDAIDGIDLDATYTARELINILRARTFPPYHGAYFVHEGKRVYMRLALEVDET